MPDVAAFLLIIVSGFVASGTIASFYTLVTGSDGYQLKPKTEAGRLAAVGLTIFTGPAVLTLNAWRARGGEQPQSYLLIIGAIALGWSYVLGLFIVSMALTLPKPF